MPITAGDALHDLPRMTTADVFEHRVTAIEKTLEKTTTEQSAIVRSLEREVDRLKIEGAAVIAAVAKLEGRLEERDTHLQSSLARLHERLDERLSDVAPLGDVTALRTEFAALKADELREEGATLERRRLWKAWFQITGATLAVLTLIAGIVFGLVQAL